MRELSVRSGDIGDKAGTIMILTNERQVTLSIHYFLTAGCDKNAKNTVT